MKVLSMIQPWASLFVLREAEYETRSWKTNYRGPLAIHTSKKKDLAVCKHVAIQALLQKHGYTTEKLPTGKIIAICELVDCLRVIQNDGTSAVLEDGRIVTENDFFLGDYQVGGFVWVVQEMQQVKREIPAKGQLGLWEYNLDIKDI
ncbi:2-oxoglutarate dehydrogenase E1 [Halalkalibacter akibai]|uniref:2-oxoglutarate dehydrogenase E1 n=1 Tax=Halalkalibacter akibai (strain ATCC 43226 / DSM 21942 / CIP 109018 / JCM 9157 / 1139) TaxID=1236973 RepID=W4QTY8_HALA3|nr:2-oxoglutarate dehydrogenase E1 [Halalkalibacter akibai]GAE35377.1 hypothetical protein JCM9157_2479 [Halalkalibacter akibai JCM 9157]